MSDKKKKSFFKISLHNLFYNNKYLFIFSVILAVLVWIVVVMEFSPETTYTIRDVPVVIKTNNTTAEKLDLQPFTDQEYTVDVTITGKRYAIRSSDISADDFTVSANMNYVDSVGNHSLQLIAQPKNSNADYTITELSTDRVDVYFDAYKEIEVSLKTRDVPDGLVPDGYYCDEFVVSESTVTIGGASTQINKLDTENIYADINDEDLESSRNIVKTTQYNADVKLVDNYGNLLNYVYIKDDKDIIITAPVLKKAELATTVDFKNTPDNYADYIEKISFSPSTINIGAAEDVISTMKKVSVGSIDFSKVKSGNNKFTFKKSDLTNIKVLDDTETFTVTVDIFEAISKKITIPESRISFTNVPDNCTVSLVNGDSNIDSVVLYGSEKALKKFDSEDAYAVIDMTDVPIKTGRKTLFAKIVVNNADCWAYGVYKIPVNIVEK